MAAYAGTAKSRVNGVGGEGPCPSVRPCVCARPCVNSQIDDISRLACPIELILGDWVRISFSSQQIYLEFTTRLQPVYNPKKSKIYFLRILIRF